MTEESPDQNALLQALRILKASDKTEAELTGRLLRKGFDRETVGMVIEHLKQKRFLDDRRVVEQTVRRGQETRLEGKQKILHRLLQRGVPPNVIKETANQLSEQTEEDRALQALDKKFKPDDDALKGARYLVRRGFEEEVVRHACETYFQATDEFSL